VKKKIIKDHMLGIPMKIKY